MGLALCGCKPAHPERLRGAQSVTHRCSQTHVFDVADFFAFRGAASGPGNVLTH